MKANQIRVIALGLIRDSKSCQATQPDRLFVSEGYDPVKRQTFYRALGGGVDFGESSLEALKREFQEEIQAELINIRYLGCLENLFSYNGLLGHELIQLYQCDFADPKFYQLEKLDFSESDSQHTALWVEIDRFKSGELKLVPETCLNYLQS